MCQRLKMNLNPVQTNFDMSVYKDGLQDNVKEIKWVM